jgi:hypothetical protein
MLLTQADLKARRRTKLTEKKPNQAYNNVLMDQNHQIQRDSSTVYGHHIKIPRLEGLSHTAQQLSWEYKAASLVHREHKPTTSHNPHKI